jgi:hypothetical protein
MLAPGEAMSGDTGKTTVSASLMLLQIAQKSGVNFDRAFGDRVGCVLADRFGASAKIPFVCGAIPAFAK